MPELIIWKNQQFDKLRKDMDRMFDRLWGELGLSAFPRIGKDFPSIDLLETKDSFIIKAELPNINPKDITIDITDTSLKIKGETRQKSVNEKAGYVRTEKKYGSFSKMIQLPHRIVVDGVRATYKDGVLNITVPKYKRKKVKAVRIEI